METRENSNKRTFSEFFKRDGELMFRLLKLDAKWHIFNALYPIKSLFVFRKFKRVRTKIQEQINNNRKEGYWI